MALSLRATLSTHCAVLVCVLSLLRTAYGADKAKGFVLNYNQKGADWPDMCQAGKAQSPIDINTDELVEIEGSSGMLDIESLGVVSGASMFLTETLPHFEVTWEKFVEEPVIRVPARKEDGDVLAPLKGDLKDNELTMVKIAPLQFHFHNPSENTRDGELFAGGLHIVSGVLKGESEVCDKKIEAGSGCFVVLSVFLSEASFYSPFNALFKKVTSKERQRMERGGNQQLPFGAVLPRLGKEDSAGIGFFDLNMLMPSSSQYVTWSGSLTTYPCTEEILWVQFLQPIPITFKQVSAMRRTIARRAGEDCSSNSKGVCTPLRRSFNNREIQPVNDRVLRTGLAF